MTVNICIPIPAMIASDEYTPTICPNTIHDK